MISVYYPLRSLMIRHRPPCVGYSVPQRFVCLHGMQQSIKLFVLFFTIKIVYSSIVGPNHNLIAKQYIVVHEE